MILFNLNSMSVKELSARLSVLFVMCVFAVAAKALVAQPAYMDGSMGYYIQLESGDALDGGGSSAIEATFKDEEMTPAGFEGNDPVYKQGIFKDSSGKLFLRYRSASGIPGDVYLSDIEKIKLITETGVNLKGDDFDALKNNYTSLNYLDLENCDVENVKYSNDNSFYADNNPLKKNLPQITTLETIVFPAIDGLCIPQQAFYNNRNIKTVIFPDLGEPTISTSSSGTVTTPKYYIGPMAFQSSSVQRVSLGYGFTSSDVSRAIFADCNSLVTVVLNNYISYLPASAFENCYNLEYIDLPMYLTALGNLCFKKSGLKTITLPDFLEIKNGAQLFQGCFNLSDIYVNTDNMIMAYQGLMEENQTKIGYDNNNDGIWDERDYVNASGSGHAEYGRPSSEQMSNNRTGQVATVLHYPGTIASKENYRVPAYLHYHGVDEATGTTWPNAWDLQNIVTGWEGYSGFDKQNIGTNYSANDPTSWYAGFQQFALGAQNIKEQDVFYENRITEARWYTICYPMDLTKTQFESAYGVNADLRVFSSATYNAEKNAVVLNFDQHETEDDGIYLKKNVPYMVHPARLNYREEKVLNRVTDPNTGEFLGYEYVKEDIYINGVKYTQDQSRQVLAFYNIKSDLFARKKADGSDDPTAIQNAIDAAESKLDENMVEQHCDGVDKNMDFTYRGNYQIETKNGGSYGKSIPAGAFYLGMWPGEPETLGFYKSDGSVSWPQYVAAILPGTKADNTNGSSASQGDAGAKLDVSFFGEDVVDVTTEINNAPQIQINIIKASDKVYNMNGQMVLESAKNMKSLPKGIYVVNVRKIAVK